jgi:hypothetical protein
MSWGNRLLITFIVFGAGMIFLVIRSVGITTELVEPDYYQQELVYQSQLDASARATEQGPVTIDNENDTIIFSWPSQQQNKSISGEAWFYCAYDKKRDRRIPIQTDNGQMQIDRKQLKAGRYTVKLNWDDGQEQYYQENTLDIIP